MGATHQLPHFRVHNMLSQNIPIQQILEMAATYERIHLPVVSHLKSSLTNKKIVILRSFHKEKNQIK